MKIGCRVKHETLGIGTVIEFCKYGGVLVDYTSETGVLVRVSHRDKLEVLCEQKTAKGT